MSKQTEPFCACMLGLEIAHSGRYGHKNETLIVQILELESFAQLKEMQIMSLRKITEKNKFLVQNRYELQVLLYGARIMVNPP